ncbi:hypothetical protein AAW00_02085 [Aurantiacibacter luteus]|uniref:Phage tail collar domain-containing protein n=2 Tax=Aurantiacibacter luteus TaxID=1581420 RepID=A0A0G9MZL2_9SPHN|nr:hypothetical protein AAW00_02085 [Aurantiacibacter luteus]
MLVPAAPASAQADEPLLGQLMLVGYNFCPRGWAQASGQLLPISQNSALFSLLGTTYGGNGTSNFQLPDLRGRAAIGIGQGPGLADRVLGELGGVETVTLSLAQLPSHTHVGGVRAFPSVATTTDPAGNYLAQAAGGNLAYAASTTAPTNFMNPETVSVSGAGGSQAHSNLSPYLTLKWCIALQGIFPSRN